MSIAATRWHVSMLMALSRGLSKNHNARSDTKALRSYLRNSTAHVNTEYPNWDAAGQVLAIPSVNDTRVQARQAPSLAEFATTQYASSPNRIINEFSRNQTAARTLHFITADELGYRLFGGHGFLYFPDLTWQVSDSRSTQTVSQSFYQTLLSPVETRLNYYWTHHRTEWEYLSIMQS